MIRPVHGRMGCMSLELLSERVGDVLVVRIEGEFVLGPKLRHSAVVIREATEAKSFVVDLAGCMKLDSAGMGELLMWFSLTAKGQKRMLLAGVRESIRQIMRVARVDSILLMAEDRTAALAELGWMPSREAAIL